MDEESLLRKILAGELHYAKLWLLCLALRGVVWDPKKMTFEQRELAFQATDAAFNCLSVFLNSPTYRCVHSRSAIMFPILTSSIRAALRYAIHFTLVSAIFSALFLLKMANLFPSELDINAYIGQVEQLHQLILEVARDRRRVSFSHGYSLESLAQRRQTCSYAPALDRPLKNIRHKLRLVAATDDLVPDVPQSSMPDMPQGFHDSGGHQPWEDFSIDIIEGGFPYGAMPPWVQEHVRLLRIVVSFLALNGFGQSAEFDGSRPSSQCHVQRE
jgi:hypothetical protein